MPLYSAVFSAADELAVMRLNAFRSSDRTTIALDCLNASGERAFGGSLQRGVSGELRARSRQQDPGWPKGVDSPSAPFQSPNSPREITGYPKIARGPAPVLKHKLWAGSVPAPAKETTNEDAFLTLAGILC